MDAGSAQTDGYAESGYYGLRTLTPHIFRTPSFNVWLSTLVLVSANVLMSLVRCFFAGALEWIHSDEASGQDAIDMQTLARRIARALEVYTIITMVYLQMTVVTNRDLCAVGAMVLAASTANVMRKSLFQQGSIVVNVRERQDMSEEEILQQQFWAKMKIYAKYYWVITEWVAIQSSYLFLSRYRPVAVTHNIILVAGVLAYSTATISQSAVLFVGSVPGLFILQQNSGKFAGNVLAVAVGFLLEAAVHFLCLLVVYHHQNLIRERIARNQVEMQHVPAQANTH